jgi:hypothetical protein
MNDSPTKSEPVICRCCLEDIPPSGENPNLVCPKCGTENRLGPPAIPPPSLSASTPAPQSLRNPNLRTCADCGKEVSIHAEACPHCGAAVAKRKHHGVFFYVFWGVMSLIATGIIILVALAMLTGFFAGVHQSVTSSSETVPTATPKSVPLTAQEAENAQAILKEVLRTKDQITGTTWLKPPWAEKYDNQIYLYIGLSESKDPFLRLKIECESKELLGIKDYVFRIDDVVATIEPTKMLKTDYVVDNYWQSFDELAEPHLQVIQKVAKGSRVLMRYNGRQDTQDRTLSQREQDSLAEMLLAYRYLKENPRGALSTQ